MDKIREFFKRDKFAELAGIELLEVSPGTAKARMTIGPQHLNGVDIVHGGAIFTLSRPCLRRGVKFSRHGRRRNQRLNIIHQGVIRRHTVCPGQGNRVQSEISNIQYRCYQRGRRDNRRLSGNGVQKKRHPARRSIDLEASAQVR